jgi:DNA primase (bacterial type)
MHNTFNFQTAKEGIDLVDYLASLGHRPARQSGNDYWYLSPLHEEKNASFKINRSRQLWYDHSLGKGGDLVAFAKEYYRCDYKEVLQKFSEHLHIPDNIPNKKAANTEEQKVATTDAHSDDRRIYIIVGRPIQAGFLKAYIHSRKIPFSVAAKYCKEVEFTLKSKKFIALGFKNDAGGYELRNKNFKASSSPKAPTVIQLNENSKPAHEGELAVFEGLFSFLSFMKLIESKELFVEKPDTVLVLNSLSFLDKSRQTVISYGHIDLYLDNDTAGDKATSAALSWGENLTDRRYLYDGFKDLNVYICEQKSLQESYHKAARV